MNPNIAFAPWRCTTVVGSVLRLLLLFSIYIIGATSQPGTQNAQNVLDVPYMHTVHCNSPINGMQYHVDLLPALSFHWVHNDDAWDEFSGALVWKGPEMVWLGLGFSGTGGMIGSKAIVGVPENDNSVRVFQLDSKDDSGSGLNEWTGFTKNEENFSDPSIVYDGNSTSMRFFLPKLNIFAEDAHSTQYPNMITFVFAVGKDGVLGYHKHRGAFRLNTVLCPPPYDPLASVGSTNTAPEESTSSNTTTTTDTSASGTSSYGHQAAFKTHGFFATLAFAVMLPIALSAAWFRILIPKWWIYVHVMCQCLGAFFTTIAVAAGFGGIIMRWHANERNNGHMSISHHWTGLVLFILTLFQVANGFRRPNVEAKADPTQGGFNEGMYEKICCFGLCKVPQSRRDKWRMLHRLTALSIIGMAIFQLQSGVKLYTAEYGGDSKKSLVFLWCWIGALIVFFVLLKCAMCKRSKKTRSSMRVPNLAPNRCEDDEFEELELRPAEASQEETKKFNNVV